MVAKVVVALVVVGVVVVVAAAHVPVPGRVMIVEPNIVVPVVVLVVDGVRTISNLPSNLSKNNFISI